MARRKQAWTGWGSPMHRVAGWEFDHRLNGYITTAADRFSCDCGEEFPTPSGYRKCGSCGRAWNSYVIGTDGHGKEASLEKVIVREIPVRKDVIVASKRRTAGPSKRNPYTVNYNDPDWAERSGWRGKRYDDGEPEHSLNPNLEVPGYGTRGSWYGSPDWVQYQQSQPGPHPKEIREELKRQQRRQRRQAKGRCECWDGYERVPGTKPCAEGSCRKCDGHREAMRRRQAIKGIPADADWHLDRGDTHAAWALHKEKQHGKPLSQFSDDDWAIAGNPPGRRANRRQADCGRSTGKPCPKGVCPSCEKRREARRYVAWCKMVGREPRPSGLRRFRTAEKIVRLAALPESNELADDFLSSAGQPGYADKAYQLEHNPQWKKDSWGSHDPAARAQHVTTDRWEGTMRGQGHEYLPTSWSPYYDESSGYNPVMRTPQGIASDKEWMAQGNPKPMTGITLPSDVLEGNDFGMFPKDADPSKFETWKARYPHLTQEQWDNRFIGTPPEIREERSKGTYPIEHSEKWQQWANDPAAPWRKNPNYTPGDSSGAESGLTIARRRHRYLAWCQYTDCAPSIKGYRKFAAAERTADRHDLRRRDLKKLELEKPEDDEDISIQHFSNRRRAELFDITEEGKTESGKGKPGKNPTMRKNPDDWPYRNKKMQWTKRSNRSRRPLG